MTCGVIIWLKTKADDGGPKQISLYCQAEPGHDGNHWTSYSVGLLIQNVFWKGNDIEITN